MTDTDVKPTTDRMAIYSQGICGDGAAILRDGQPVSISEIIDLLNAIDTRAQCERRREEVNRKSSAHSPQQGLATTMTAEAEASRVHGNVAKSEGSDRSAAALNCSPSFALRSPTSACNAYEPMREALTKLLRYFGSPQGVSMAELGRDAYVSLEMKVRIGDLMDAHDALSTLPVNDRQTSDDVGRLRALLEEELVWHEERDKSLSKQPPFGEKGWRRADHQERIDVIRALLSESKT